MNVLSKVTLQSLKKNKTRTIVTIIGIMLSATMICAVTTFAVSIMNYGKECTIYTEGNWHARLCDTEYETYEDLSNNTKVEQSVYLQQIGYAHTEDSKNEVKPYIYVTGVGPNAEDLLPIHITSGDYPTSSSEIILPEHLYTEGGIKYNIGDTITLELGQRMLDGSSLTKNDPCIIYTEKGQEFNGEVLETKETRTYTVVGFYERLSDLIESSYSPGYTALTVADNTPSADYKYDVYLHMENPKEINAFAEEEQFYGDINKDLLVFSGMFVVESFTKMLYGMAAIIIVLIMLGSVALIYNAFSISVSERTKQFGLLSSVGATKSQIRHMVMFEAFAVSIIGIPLGIFAGIGGIGITLLFIGNMFRTIAVPVDFTLCVSPAAIIIAIIVALLTVLISAWIPSKRATKITAVEAIRQNIDITTKGKNIKTSKLIYKLFGISGVIADKNYKRNKKKYRSTVLSLFMSIVLFVSASAFTNYLTATAVGVSNLHKCEIVTYIEPSQFSESTPEKLFDELKTAKSVTNVAYTQSLYLDAKINTECLTTEGAVYIDNNWMQDNDGLMHNLSVDVTFVEDDTFKALLKENGLSEQEYMNPEKPLAVAVDGFSMYDMNTKRQEKIEILSDNNAKIEVKNRKNVFGYYCTGEEVVENGITYVVYQKDHMSNVEGDEQIYLTTEEAYFNTTLEIGSVIYEAPFFARQVGAISLIYPYSLAEGIYGDVNLDYSVYSYMIQSDNHTESYIDVESILIDNGITNMMLMDIAQLEETRRNTIIIINVFSYGFIILISLIAAANVFNTITTNINLRRREFAMLKSIGMTQKDFNKMMNFECLLYGSRALLYGLPASVLVTFLIYYYVNGGIDMAFRLPWAAIGIAVLSVFLVVFATMLYSMRKVKKDNPIDVLKNENL